MMFYSRKGITVCHNQLDGKRNGRNQVPLGFTAVIAISSGNAEGGFDGDPLRVLRKRSKVLTSTTSETHVEFNL